MAKQGFDLLRYQKCSEDLVQDIRNRKQKICLWTFAVIALFMNLGTAPATCSEAELIRSIQSLFQDGNTNFWLHKTTWLHGWLCAVTSYFQRGADTFSIRLPSALAALLLLGSVMSIAKQLFSERAGLITGWITAVSCAFLFGARETYSFMPGAAFAFTAIACYLRNREKGQFFTFWISSGFSVLFIGISGMLIPFLFLAADLIRRKQAKRLWHWKSILAFLAGCVIYFLPVVYGMVFGCREPVLLHSLCIDLPEFNAPMFLWLLPAVIACFYGFRHKGDACFLIYFLAVWICIDRFLLNRPLPLPEFPFFCMILLGYFLAEAEESPERKICHWLFRIIDWILPVLALLTLAVPFLYRFLAPRYLSQTQPVPLVFTAVFYYFIPLAGITALIFWIVMKVREKRDRKTFGLVPGYPEADRIFPLFAMIMFCIVCLLVPYFKSEPALHPRRIFCKNIRTSILEEYRIQPENVGYYFKFPEYYVDIPGAKRLSCSSDVEKFLEENKNEDCVIYFFLGGMPDIPDGSLLMHEEDSILQNFDSRTQSPPVENREKRLLRRKSFDGRAAVRFYQNSRKKTTQNEVKQ